MQQTSTNGVLDETRLGGNGIHWELCKELKFDHTSAIWWWWLNSICQNRNPSERMRRTQFSWFWDTSKLPNPARKPNLVIINKKQRTCHRINLAIPVDHKVKIKESEKKTSTWMLLENYKSWGTWVTVIAIIIGARAAMVIVVGNGHGDTSSNPGRDWLHFT